MTNRDKIVQYFTEKADYYYSCVSLLENNESERIAELLAHSRYYEMPSLLEINEYLERNALNFENDTELSEWLESECEDEDLL